MSTFDPTQHPRGNTLTGHAGQFATKQQTSAEIDLGTELFSEITERFLNDPAPTSKMTYHGHFLCRADWGPGLAFLPADKDTTTARPEDFLVTTGGAEQFVDGEGAPRKVDTASDDRYRFVGAVDDSPVVRLREQIWRASDESYHRQVLFDEANERIWRDLPDNRDADCGDQKDFALTATGAGPALSVWGSNADGSRPFRILVTQDGTVHARGDGSQKQRRYEKTIADHAEDVQQLISRIDPLLEAGQRERHLKEQLRLQTGEYYTC